jgi:hypothetical protein
MLPCALAKMITIFLDVVIPETAKVLAKIVVEQVEAENARVAELIEIDVLRQRLLASMQTRLCQRTTLYTSHIRKEMEAAQGEGVVVSFDDKKMSLVCTKDGVTSEVNLGEDKLLTAISKDGMVAILKQNVVRKWLKADLTIPQVRNLFENLRVHVRCYLEAKLKQSAHDQDEGRRLRVKGALTGFQGVY